VNETIVWKSVEDEMPDADIVYLVIATTGSDFASYDDESGFWRYARCGSRFVGKFLYYAEEPEGPNE
jgi:hypothetical protein